MSTVNGSTLTLVCDQCNHITDTFDGRHLADVWQTIRAAGWQINQADWTCVCPDCLFQAATVQPAPATFYQPE